MNARAVTREEEEVERKRREREELKAMLRIRAGSLRSIAIAHNYEANAISVALLRPWPAVERIIGKILGVPPWKIWPDRYEKRRPKGGHRAVA